MEQLSVAIKDCRERLIRIVQLPISDRPGDAVTDCNAPGVSVTGSDAMGGSVTGSDTLGVSTTSYDAMGVSTTASEVTDTSSSVDDSVAITGSDLPATVTATGSVTSTSTRVADPSPLMTEAEQMTKALQTEQGAKLVHEIIALRLKQSEFQVLILQYYTSRGYNCSKI